MVGEWIPPYACSLRPSKVMDDDTQAQRLLAFATKVGQRHHNGLIGRCPRLPHSESMAKRLSGVENRNSWCINCVLRMSPRVHL